MEPIPDRAIGLSHPDFQNSFVIVREDGSVEIGAGKASIILHPDGEIIIHATRIRYVCDTMELNENTFNDKATNPMEPALLSGSRKLLPSDRSIREYGN
jgi:hypothetical protein